MEPLVIKVPPDPPKQAQQAQQEPIVLFLDQLVQSRLVRLGLLSLDQPALFKPAQPGLMEQQEIKDQLAL
jgi:hypothetical protein